MTFKQHLQAFLNIPFVIPSLIMALFIDGECRKQFKNFISTLKKDLDGE